jgi:hypothetical protein
VLPFDLRATQGRLRRKEGEKMGEIFSNEQDDAAVIARAT